MPALNALRILLPSYDGAFRYAALIGVITIRIDSLDRKRRRQSPQFVQIPVFTAKEILSHSVIQADTLSAHALPDALFAEHGLILFVLVLPPLIRVTEINFDSDFSIRIIRSSQNSW